ncbi:hypothetical protein [Fibrella aquatica]|uniref:hypothetical protein n=1 Tax=Fibrella aquatica TaxID=3242487 RepID=UPI003522424A
MKHRHSPLVLRYTLWLALTFSLVCNGLLLHERNLYRSSLEYGVSDASPPVGYVARQHQSTECQQVSQQKDSLMR